jgi:hypothetical protein
MMVVLFLINSKSGSISQADINLKFHSIYSIAVMSRLVTTLKE